GCCAWRAARRPRDELPELRHCRVRRVLRRAAVGFRRAAHRPGAPTAGRPPACRAHANAFRQHRRIEQGRMNPTRKRRLWLIVARDVAYLYTPSEVTSGSAGDAVRSGQARFRLGGMVAAGSFTRAQGSMEAHFKVDDGDATLPVVYTGILPDLFREKQ